jgi:RNA polymerase sigma-70 factor (ECF subfamily)
MFDDTGHWVTPNQDWGSPDKVLEQKRFWEILNACLKRLPPQLAMLYSLREISGMDTEDICKDLNISSTNSWVMLHRARLALKQCFELNWLGEKAGAR